MQLPKEFEDRMREEFGEEFESYAMSLDRGHVPSLRVNQWKISTEDFQVSCSLNLRKVPWIQNGFYLDPAEDASHHPWYYAGLFYLQEASAMTPASVLPIEPGDRVLDLCAAPGGKATELAAKLGGTGMLVANDISVSRARALLKNLEMQGFANICVTGEDPENLVPVFPSYFDKILLDAPCSGEGMVQKDAGMLKAWMEKGPDFYAPIQKKLIHQAYEMLKPGGMLVYSTCTFSKCENEEVVLSLLKDHPDCHVIPLPYSYEGFVPGDAAYHPELSHAIHVYPHKMVGAGHFTALIQKEGTDLESPSGKGGKKSGILRTSSKMPKEAEAFLFGIRRNWKKGSFLTVKDQIYYFPEELVIPEKLRYLRTGLWLGTLKNGRFAPSQALAMNLRQEEFPAVVSFEAEDQRVIRYLKGESLEIPDFDQLKGDVLVLVDGYPLGFGKADKGRLKNKYYAGWRMQ